MAKLQLKHTSVNLQSLLAIIIRTWRKGWILLLWLWVGSRDGKGMKISVGTNKIELWDVVVRSLGSEITQTGFESHFLDVYTWEIKLSELLLL